MANKSKVVGYSSAALTAGALGVALYVAGDKSLDLTDEQMSALRGELEKLDVEGTEIVDSKGNVVNGYEEVEDGTGEWKWTYKDADGIVKSAEYHMDEEEQPVTFKELKDAKGNVIGAYQVPTGDQANGELYINGKWYGNVGVVEGQLKSGNTKLGTLEGEKLTYQVDGKDVSVTVGTEGVTYNTIFNEKGQVVGYQEAANTFPKKTFLFDEAGVKTNGVLSTRENLTQAKEKLLVAVENLKESGNPIDEKALKEYINIIKGVDIKDYSTVSKYTEAVQQTVEKEGNLLNKLSAGANEVASSEIFDKVNNYLGSGIADPSSIGVISLCAVGAIAVGGITALATKAITGTDKKKVFGATSLNSSHKNINKTR